MKLKRLFYSMLVLAAVGSMMTSCGGENEIIPDDPQPEAPDPGNEANNLPDAKLTEVPYMKSGSIFVKHSTTIGKEQVMTYCLEYDTTEFHSRWVAFRFDEKTRVKSVSRGDNFQDDPDLEERFRIGSVTFNGYDRGHLCASADRLYSADANDQTFYMSNMSPQLADFNQHYWLAFEQKVQDWGRSASFADTLFVVKGGTIKKDQILRHMSRGYKSVAVPKYYFMALLRCKNNSYEALGFWMEHEKNNVATTPNAAEMAGKIVSIDKLEELTGIDFFHNLPDDLENTVEANVTQANWGF